ncbi:MAG TPA: hypothetical protein PK103_07115, partial [Elusimicrobiales bacterium]|nr:hypothetical protein [Elusimicrobiales bacterium]
ITNILLKHFRPEFINRIDEIITFKNLTKEDIFKIIDIQLGNIKEILKQRGIDITIDDGVREFLFKQGYNPEFGARPLKRAISRHLTDKLAVEIIKNSDVKKYKISAGENGIICEPLK